MNPYKYKWEVCVKNKLEEETVLLMESGQNDCTIYEIYEELLLVALTECELFKHASYESCDVFIWREGNHRINLLENCSFTHFVERYSLWYLLRELDIDWESFEKLPQMRERYFEFYMQGRMWVECNIRDTYREYGV